MLNSTANKYINAISQDKLRTKALDKDKYYRLDLAEGNLPISKKVLKTANTLTEAVLTSLPDRNSTILKSKIAEFIRTKIDQISIFSGSDEIIELIPRMYLASKNNALVVTPTFNRLISTNLKVGASVIQYKLSKENSFELKGEDLEKIQNIIDKRHVKIVWLCTPNNPIGNILDINYIRKLALKNKNVLFIVDEVHQEFYSLDPKKTCVSLINQCKNIMVVRSFSKAFCLAGVRIGYLVGSESNITAIEKFRTMYNISSVAQKLACVALDDLGHVSKVSKVVSKGRNKIYSLIKKSTNLTACFNSQTNLITFKHNTINTWEGLLSLGALSTNLETSPGLEASNYVRICLGNTTHNEHMLEILQRLDKK